MESVNMFELEAAIASWRRGVSDVRAIPRRRGDELEAHLRDEIAALQPQLSSEEAFLVAVRRLGDVESLGHEFAKADPVAAWRGNAAWITLGMLVVVILGNVRGMCSQLFMLWMQQRHASTAELVTLPLIAPLVIALVVLAVFALLLHRTTPRPWRQIAIGWLPLAALGFLINAYVRSPTFTGPPTIQTATDHEHHVMWSTLNWAPEATFVVQLALCGLLLFVSRRRGAARVGTLQAR
jgi:hypothetical protein